MAQEEEYQIPIFLINGQLDSGKTTRLNAWLFDGKKYSDAIFFQKFL